MVGDDNGNFNPTQDVTRAEMAVIITRILYGNDLNVDQFKGMNLFTDVPAWAEGFVNLCASLDIVAGVGDGKFAPNETVTAAQAALMLSRALGYFQNNAEFGNDWALAAIRRATSAGIIGDDMVLAANEGLSRDNVAQMTFNTLTKAVPVQYNELLNVYYNENQGITYALTFNYLQTLGYTNFDLVYDNGDTTIYGRPATTWGIGTYRTTTSDKDSGSRYDEALDANGGLISSNVQILSRDEIITIENEPTYTYTDATAEEDIYDDLGDAVCNDQRGQKAEDEYDWTVYVNGEELKSDDVVIPARNESSNYAYTGEGARTEIYVDDADKTVTVVEINYYLGQVSSVNEEEGTASIRTVSDLKGDGAKLDDRTFATTEFAKGDYVVFTIDQNADDDFYICEMTAPETVDGTVTRVNKNNDSDNSYLFLNRETRYDYSDHMAYDLNDETVVQHPSLEEDYTLFLDPNGYVLAYSGDTTQRFLYVEDSAESLGWDMKAVLSDGTDDTAAVDEDIDGIAGTDNIWYLNAKQAIEKFDLDTTDSKVWLDWSELGRVFDRNNTTVSSIDYQIFEYETNDEGDTYSLTARDTRYATGVEINQGEAYVDTQEKYDDILVDNSTIFVDVESNTVYTGYNEVPDVSNAKIAYVVEGDSKSNNDVAEIIYIIDGDIYDADAIFFVLTSSDRDTEKYDGDNYFEFDDMYVDGHHKTGLYVSYDALTELGIGLTDESIEDAMVGEVYKVLKSEDGTYITKIQHVDDWDYVDVATSSSLWIGLDTKNQNKYTTDDETTYVVIEEEYNKDLTKLTGYDVSEGGYGDIIEDAKVEDGYVTEAQVVKADDNNAQLVYIWKYNPEFYLHDITVKLDGQVVKTVEDVSGPKVNVNVFEELEDLYIGGYTFTYTVSGINQTFTVNTTNPLSTTYFTLVVPVTDSDVTVEITSRNDDIITNGRVTLNTAFAENADPNDVTMDGRGSIDYSFKYTGEGDAVTYAVTLFRNGVQTGGKVVETAPVVTALNGDRLVYGQASVVYLDTDDLITVVITDVKPVTEEEAPEVPTDVTADLNGTNVTVNYKGEKPSLDVALQAILNELAAQGYTDVTYTYANNAYTFEAKDSDGYPATFTWKVSDVVEVVTYTLDGKEVTYPVGTVIDYTSNWIVVNGEGKKADVTPAEGDVIETDMLKITEGDNVSYIKNGDTYTVKGAEGSTYAEVNGVYVKYGDETVALNTDTTVNDGYVSYTIMNADDTVSSQNYVPAGVAQGAIAVGNGTGYIYTVNGDDKGYRAKNTAIPATDMNGDVIVYRGYVEVTYTNGTNFTVTGPAYAPATGTDAGKITVEYTVTGLQGGDIKTVTFGGINVAASQDEWAVSAGETSITPIRISI